MSCLLSSSPSSHALCKDLLMPPLSFLRKKFHYICFFIYRHGFQGDVESVKAKLSWESAVCSQFSSLFPILMANWVDVFSPLPPSPHALRILSNSPLCFLIISSTFSSSLTAMDSNLHPPGKRLGGKRIFLPSGFRVLDFIRQERRR